MIYVPVLQTTMPQSIELYYGPGSQVPWRAQMNKLCSERTILHGRTITL